MEIGLEALKAFSFCFVLFVFGDSVARSLDGTMPDEEGTAPAEWCSGDVPTLPPEQKQRSSPATVTVVADEGRK